MVKWMWEWMPNTNRNAFLLLNSGICDGYKRSSIILLLIFINIDIITIIRSDAECFKFKQKRLSECCSFSIDQDIS